MANLKINNNLSTSAISRLEKVMISKLCVVSDFDAKILKGSRGNTSIVWRYFGALQQSTADGKPLFWTTIIVYIVSMNVPCIALSV